MLTKLVGFIVFIAAFNSAQCRDQNDKNGISLVIYAQNYEPFNFEKNGQFQGLNVALLFEILKRAGIEKTANDIKVSSWARAYNSTLKNKNALLLTTARTKERENLFKWIGPIGISITGFFSHNRQIVEIKKPADLNKYLYATSRSSLSEQSLLSRGVNSNQIIRLSTQDRAVELLNRGRIDVWVYDTILGFQLIKRHGYQPKNYSVVYSFDQTYHYFALNRHSDDWLQKKLQNALNSVQEDCTHFNIYKHYREQLADSYLTQEMLHGCS